MYPPTETDIRKPSALSGRKLDMASRNIPDYLYYPISAFFQVWFSNCLYIPSRYINVGCAFPALSCVSGTFLPPNSRSLGRTSWSASQVAAPSLRIFLGSLGRAWPQSASHVKSNQSKYQRTSSWFSPLEILYSTVSAMYFFPTDFSSSSSFTSLSGSATGWLAHMPNIIQQKNRPVNLILGRFFIFSGQHC